MSASSPVEQSAAVQTTRLDKDLTGHLPVTVALSSLISEEAKQYLRADVAKGGLPSLAGNIADVRAAIDNQIAKPTVAAGRQMYPVEIEGEFIGGVQTDVITPLSGVASNSRVLINLHGGVSWSVRVTVARWNRYPWPESAT
jgi:hypothetical protein